MPTAETFGAMAELVAAGKVRAFGVAEATAQELRRAHGVHQLALAQFEWSTWARGSEAELVPAARELGIGIVIYGPLGSAGSSPAQSMVGTLTWPRGFKAD